MSKVLLITGGIRGIGAVAARLAAAEDYDVCISLCIDGRLSEKRVERLE